MSMTRGKHVLKKVKVRDTRDDPFVLPLETAIILLKADFASMSPVYGKGDGEGKEPPVASPSMLLKPSSIPTWEQPTSEQMAHNLLLAEMPMSKHPDFNPELKVAKIKVEPHLAHEAYCDLVEGLQVQFGDEGRSELHLGETAWRGGWDGPGYDNCNMGQMPFSKKVQACSAFPVGNGKVNHRPNPHCLKSMEGSLALEAVYEKVLQEIKKDGSPFAEKQVILGEYHVLFGYSQETHFAFHRDSNTWAGKHAFKPDLTAIIQVSRDNSSMFVAGAASPAKYEGAGDGVLFDADLYHRSGLMRYGTVKVAFFFKVEGAVVLSSDDDEDEGGTSGILKSPLEEEEE